MKKFIKLLIFTILLIYPSSVFAADTNINFIIDGKYVYEQTDVEMVQNRTMVPVRSFFEKSGVKVNWNQEKKTIELSKNKEKIEMKIDSEEVIVNGKKQKLDAKPYLKNDIAYVPLRFVSENLGEKVQWDGKNKIVLIGNYLEDFSESIKILENGSEDFVKNVEVVTTNDKVIFLDKYNAKLNNDTNRGHYFGEVFNISETEKPGEIPPVVPWYIIGYKDGHYLVATFVTDVRYNPEDKKSIEIYEKCVKESKLLIENLLKKN